MSRVCPSSMRTGCVELHAARPAAGQLSNEPPASIGTPFCCCRDAGRRHVRNVLHVCGERPANDWGSSSVRVMMPTPAGIMSAQMPSQPTFAQMVQACPRRSQGPSVLRQRPLNSRTLRHFTLPLRCKLLNHAALQLMARPTDVIFQSDPPSPPPEGERDCSMQQRATLYGAAASALAAALQRQRAAAAAQLRSLPAARCCMLHHRGRQSFCLQRLSAW